MELKKTENNLLILLRFILLLILLLFSQVLLNIQLQKYRVETPPSEERSYKIDPILVKTLTFGHLAPVVDWLWMMCIVDSSIEHVKPGTHPQFYYDLDLLTDLDPRFFEAYLVGASLLSIVRNDGTGAKNILNKAEDYITHDLSSQNAGFRKKYWSKPWEIYSLLGYVYLFELSDIVHASQAFIEAAKIPGAPRNWINIQKMFEKPGGVYEVGLRLLSHMILSAKEDRIKEELEKKKENLSISKFLYDLNYAFVEWMKSYDAKSHDGRKSEKTNRRLELAWNQFILSKQIPSKDPWGGVLSMDPSGKIISSTPHFSVFGLE